MNNATEPDFQGQNYDPSPAATDITNGQVQHLAQTLGYAFRIAEGGGLVFVLGNGKQHDNHEALAHWVREQVTTLDPELAGALLPILIGRLEKTLRAYEVDGNLNSEGSDHARG